MMPRTTATVFDVAAHLMKEYAPMIAEHGPMTAMKLQKLVYYCQAWSLAWDEGPLFEEKIEAWVHGPVVHTLYALNRGKYEIHELGADESDPSKLREEQKETVRLVVKHYGPLKTRMLTALTHQERPWQEARKRADLKPTERSREPILHADMKEYYSSI